MLITRSREPRLVYDEVDWGLLVFFVGLFLIVGGAEKAGVTERLLDVRQQWNLHHPGDFHRGCGGTLQRGQQRSCGHAPEIRSCPASPTRTGLARAGDGSTLAGNLTITGSVANIIVVERARAEAPIGFSNIFRVGLPITAVTLLFGWLWLRWIG